GDDEVQGESEQCGSDSALVRGRAEQATCDSLKKAERLSAHDSVNDDRGRNVHDAADGTGRNDCLSWIGHDEAPNFDSVQRRFRRILDGFVKRTQPSFAGELTTQAVSSRPRRGGKGRRMGGLAKRQCGWARKSRCFPG